MTTSNGHSPSGPVRVVITGLGLLTPLGLDLESSWQAMRAGQSGARAVTHFPAEDLPTRIAAHIADFDPSRYMEKKEARRVSRATQFAWKVAQDALADAGLAPSTVEGSRLGVEIGIGFGGWEILEEQAMLLATQGPRRFNPAATLSALASGTPTYVAIQIGANGPTSCDVAACAAGIVAIGEATRRIQRGDADVMLAGGAEGYLTRLTLTTFSRLGAASTNNDDPAGACRPFSGDRDGMVVGEGAAMMVLERLEHAQARGARILAEVVGFGYTEDAYDPAAPDPEGRGAKRAMQLALDESGLAPAQIDWIVAHGTGTVLNDKVETAAIKAVLGDAAYDVPVTSIKSMIGHSMGAAGAQSAVAIVKAMQEETILPTINYTTPDPACDLDYVTEGARTRVVNAGLCNGFGMGGQNGSLLLKRFEPGDVV